MKFTILSNGTTRTFVFEGVELPGTADLYAAVEEARGYRDETIVLRDEAEVFRVEAQAAAQETEADKSTTLDAREDVLLIAGQVATDRGIVQDLAGQVTTDRGIVQDLAGQVTTDRAIVEDLAGQVTTDRGVSATQAGIATAQAGLATAQAGLAAGSATQAATSATQAGTSATQAATSSANAVAAAGQATQVAFGQGTGIAGIIPTARIRANSAFLSPEFTFTRPGSVGMAFNRQLRLANAQNDVPRFEFDPLTGEALGILVETSKTKSFPQSNNFGNASWNKNNSTVVPNSGISVDGENNAWLLRESSDSVASIHFVGGISVTINAGTEYTFSIFAKAATRSNLLIALPGTATWAGATSELQFSFNLIAGTVTRTQGSGGAGSIQNIGNGWYRCSVTVTATASSTTDPRFVLESSTGVRDYVGDGTSGLLIYGAQAEVGGLSSYIPTTTTVVTRRADSFQSHH